MRQSIDRKRVHVYLWENWQVWSAAALLSPAQWREARFGIFTHGDHVQDAFAMYHSKVLKYDIVDATPLNATSSASSPRPARKAA